MLKISNLRYEILRDVIISDFSLQLRAGEVKTLFGPSGCGKTSLLRLVCGLEDKKSGQIENGFKKISFLFQENRLLPNLTALKNIEIFSPADVNEIYALAAKIGLSPSDLNKFPCELSGGMQKRTAFLRTILSGCDLALLDEPFVGLDRDLRGVLIEILVSKIEREGLACLLVTHDRFEAARLSHEIIELEPKGMGLRRVVSLDEPLGARDERYEERVVSEQFGGVSYYE
nr:ATP-binding cassette domain-containing protein [uncultured Campylobacter sp.]